MILFAHMLFGAAIGATVKNPVFAIPLALLGHYFLDLFPHIEYLEGVEASIKDLKERNIKKNLVSASKVAADFFGGLVVIAIVSHNQPIVYICALVACIPDGLTVLSNLFPNKLLAWHDYWHGQKIHYLTKQKKIPVFWKITTQVVVVVVSIVLLRY